MVDSYIVYLGVLLITVLMAKAVNCKFSLGSYAIKTKEHLLMKAVMVSLPILIIMSLREGIGTDYSNYLRIYNNFSISYKSTLEMGYRFLMWIALKSGLGFRAVITFSAVLTVVPFVFWIFKDETKDKTMMLIIMFCLLFASWNNSIRQGIAEAILIFAARDIEKKRAIPFCFKIFIAFLFHESALVFLPCYFLVGNSRRNLGNTSFYKNYGTKFWNKTFLIILGICILFFIYMRFGREWNLIYSGYIDAGEVGGTTRYFFFFSVLLVLFEVLFAKKMIMSNQRFELYYLLAFIEILMYGFGMMIPYGFRMAHLFSFSHIVLIPNILTTMNNKNDKLIIKFVLVSLLIIRFCLFYGGFGYEGIVPYVSIYG